MLKNFFSRFFKKKEKSTKKAGGRPRRASLEKETNGEPKNRIG